MAQLPLALDIETVGQDWESLAPEVQAYLMDRAKSDTKRAEVPTDASLIRSAAIQISKPKGA